MILWYFEDETKIKIPSEILQPLPCSTFLEATGVLHVILFQVDIHVCHIGNVCFLKSDKKKNLRKSKKILENYYLPDMKIEVSYITGRPHNTTSNPVCCCTHIFK